MTAFIATRDLADLAGVSHSALRKAVVAIESGERTTWRGSALVIRHVRGRGGRAGWLNEVLIESLPADLKAALKGGLRPLQLALKLDDAAAEVRNMRFHIIGPALKTEPRSPERTAAIEARAAEHFSINGRPFPVSVRSIERWMAGYEAEGFAGLNRKKRADAGEAAVIVTRAFDAAVTIDEAAKAQIASRLDGYIGGLVKAGESPSILQALAQRHLAELARKAGCTLDAATLQVACKIPLHLIRQHKNLKKVHRFTSDAKGHADARSRIRRSRDGLAPNDVWVMDVHPLDIACRRDNGTIAHAKGIATLDLASNRIRIDWLLCDEGKGVTARHVIEHFTATVEAWGAPRALYLDNGSEYRWAEFIDDALKLIDQDGRRYVDDLALWSERRSNIVRARAYNAPAKPIEGIFGVLERKHFHVIPGWVGGDRMRKKTANVGKAPEPFDGTFAELRELLDRMVYLYNETPQLGSALKGKAPHDVVRRAGEGGWQRVAIEPGAFLVAFSTPKVAKVRQGQVLLKGPWTSRALQSYQGDTVTLLVPKYEHFDRLPYRDEAGNFVGFLERDRPFAILDPAGAVEARAREKASRDGVRELARSVPDVDPIAERMKLIGTLPPPPETPIGSTLGASPEAKAIQADRKATPADRKALADAAQERRWDEQRAREASDRAYIARLTAKSTRKLPEL